jgi:hypothetical protein
MQKPLSHDRGFLLLKAISYQPSATSHYFTFAKMMTNV